MATIVWGSIDINGNILSGSGDFSVEHPSPGTYRIIFQNDFHGIPGVTATQNNWGSLSQSNLDGVVVPIVDNSYCDIVTGNGDPANHQPSDRAFAFIAIGN